MKRSFTAAVGVMILACGGSSAVAQSPTGPPAALSANEAPAPVPPEVITRDGDGRVAVRAVRIPEPLTIDGQLTEEWYRTVRAIDGFVQQDPREFEPASEPTEAWIFFDDENLYIAARNWDSQPDRMVVNELRHDSNNLIQNENLAIVLDTFHDRRNGVLFLVSALGGMLEEAFFDERNPTRDWNTVWNARTARFDQGWTVEVVIPFKSLRYRPGSGQTWGIQMNRLIRWKNERTYLTPVPRSAGIPPFRISLGATLVGLETPPLAKNIEIKPYAIAGLSTDRTAQPVPISNDGTGDVGLDVKYGVTGSLTADFTVNTDFAQVEEDEQQVNLTRFNLFFPEKREFFLEGQGIFNFGGRSAGGGGDQPILFFSRQIGISQGRPVPIIAGGRLTGRAGDFNVGGVNIQTDEYAPARAAETNFTALRLRRDVLRRSTVGALFTNRSVSLRGPGTSQTYGVDGLFSLYQNVRVDTYVARTQTPGLSGDDLSYRGSFDYNADRYGLNGEHLAVGANFNPEVGFLRRSDFRKSSAQVRFSPRPESPRIVRKYYYTAGYTYVTTGSGRLESRLAGAGFGIELQSGDNVNAMYRRSYELIERPFRVAGQATIPVGRYSWDGAGASYQFGPQRRIAGTVSVARGGLYTGTQTSAAYRGRVAVHPQLALEPQVSINWIDLPQGRLTTKLVSTRATAPLTPRMFVSALLQYNSSANAFNSNIRLRWEYQPGSELFVVFTEGRNTLGPGSPELETRGFVVKINRLFRL
ncbi:MAG: carbohydrate binding family 9 domain-containing protein [Acidobacteria bacterium]|nr:carbohydrate binding family 9 domain-containing protein [Acidobacteriota bacterium]